MKRVDVKSSIYIYILTLVKKLMINILTLKYRNIFAKDYAPNWSKEDFVIKKAKNTVPWTYVINNRTKNCCNFLRKRIAKTTNQKECTIAKVIKRKGDKLYAKWEGNDNLYNSWIDKKKHTINE